MSSNLIIMDVDGVVIDSPKAVLKAFSVIEGIDYTKREVKKWNFTDAIPHLTDKDSENIFASDLFWREVEFINGAKEFINKHSDRIVFCSLGDVRNQLRKIEFLNKHFPKIPMLPVIQSWGYPKTIGKHLIKMGKNAVFIEDSASNLNDSDAELKILFSNTGFDCEWNRDILVEHKKAVNFEEIDKLIEEFDRK